MKLAYIGLAVLAVAGWLTLGLFIASGPQPEIVVAAEVMTKVGPLNISNSLIAAWTTMAVLIAISLFATRSMRLIPSGTQNFIEGCIDFLLSQVEEVAGKERGRQFFTVIATFFLFILVSNWLGLLPFFNAIGKTEDVGHEVFHEIALHDAEGHAFEEEEHFAAWKMDETSGIGVVKPGKDDFEFVIPPGTEPADALAFYVVALAEEYTDFRLEDAAEGEAGHAPAEADVAAAAEALATDPSAPQLLFETGGDEHAVAVAGLDEAVSGVDFPGQKLALVIPAFRSTFSDVNNTIALAICSFLIVEFWGFRALGFGYLNKFFVAPWKNPMGTFVGFLELLSEFIRIISFAFRLFGNIFAGEVLILMLTFLMPFLFVDVIYGLELFVGFIQAAVFALLTLVFASMAVEHHGEDHDEDHGHATDPPGAQGDGYTHGAAQAH